LGDIDFVLGDEWQHQPRLLPEGVERHSLMSDRVRLVLPARHPAARRHADAVPMAELAGDAWTTGHAGLGWDEMTRRTCLELGGFEPDVRHRTNDAGISLEVISQGLAVGMLPDLAFPRRLPGITLRDIADTHLSRTIFAATRATDAARPSTRALLAAVRAASTGA
jgi:DNA-binding transcriptional LysR family regulator